VRSTILGDVELRSVDSVRDSLFLGAVHTREPAQGRFVNCAFPHDFSMNPGPGCVRLDPTTEGPGEPMSQWLELISREIGQPGYAIPTDESIHLIGSEASNGSEIGVYNSLFNNRRMHLLQRTLSEFLPVGWAAAVRITQ